MARPLSEQTVVLTGASSGIGKETAVELGRRGANLVLAARTEEALRNTAQEAARVGGTAEVVVTDVADPAQVDRLADRAVERFGRIDTWVNNAAVSEFATVENTRPEELERLMKVNLLGPIYGMQAALRVMKPRGDGTIVNVASVLGHVSVPLQAGYCASKHGLIGFADSLRLELKREESQLEVVTVMPSSINTPFFDNARARLAGHAPQPMPPAYDPSAVAQAIARVCEHPQRDVVVGGAGKIFVLLNRIHPKLVDWAVLMNDAGARMQISDRPDDGRDNLDRPIPGVKPARGQWGDEPWSLGGSLYTQLFELHPPLKAAAIGLAAVGAVGLISWLTSRRSESPDFARAVHGSALARGY